MKKIFYAAFFCLLCFSAADGICAAATLYEDPESGQLFTKPADGRVPVDAVKDLQIPASAVNNLYEDESGAVYVKPAEGRTRVVFEAPVAPSTTTAKSSTAPGDYSSAAFADAVKNVIGDQESKTYPKVKMGALFYGEYFYDFDNDNLNSDGSHRNKFTLNRGYINLRAEMTPEIKARITPDITRDSTGDIKLRLKFGYVDFHDFIKAYPSLEVKLGQYETAWLDYEEGLWTYRVLDTMLIEKEGFMNSADLGVGIKGRIPAGFGDWQVDVINGEGYHADENNKYKTVQGRLTLTPLPMNEWTKGLHLTGFASVGKEDQLHKRDRYIAFIGYKYKDDLFVGGEYDVTRGKDGKLVSTPAGVNNVEGHGWSALAWYRMPFWSPIRVLGRYDRFDHDDDVKETNNTRWLYGVSYDINKNVMFVLDNERTVSDKGLKDKSENLLKVDVQWTF